MTIAQSYIGVDGKGRAHIEGSRVRVSMIVCDKMNGMSPEDIHEAYPHISMSQIHAALAYYYDHQREIDSEIADEVARYEAARAEAIASGRQPTRAQLEARLREKQA